MQTELPHFLCKNLLAHRFACADADGGGDGASSSHGHMETETFDVSGKSFDPHGHTALVLGTGNSVLAVAPFETSLL